MTEVMSILVVFVVPVALFAAVLTIPRWCVRLIHQNRLWAIRDAVMDDVLAGRLPAEHRSVRTLLSQLEDATSVCTRVSLLLLVANRTALRRHPDTAESLRRIYVRETNAAGLSADERALLEGHRHRMHVAMNGNVMFGSWLGIAFFVSVFAGAIVRAAVRGAGAIARAGSDALSVSIRSRVADAAHVPAARVDQLVDEACLPLATASAR